MASINGTNIDPTDLPLVSKSFTINSAGTPKTVTRSLVELKGSSMNDLIKGSNIDAEFIDLGSGNDTAYGGGSDDLIDGGSGNDRLFGDAGHDDLRGGFGFDSLYGGSGNDVLNGGADADLLVGGTGDDLYIMSGSLDTVQEAAGEGFDTIYTDVKFVTLPANVEQLIASPASTGAQFTGNALANRLVGTAFNDMLNGAGGADSMEGGAGNDNYYVDHAADKVIEADVTAAGGTSDQVFSALTSYTLPSGIENLFFTTPAATSVTGLGNAAGNKISGNAGNDVLYGYGGNDMLSGGAGADSLFGGLGDDIYVADSSDTIEESIADGGYDRIYTNSAVFQMPVFVEELQFDIAIANGQIVGPVHFTGLGSSSGEKMVGNLGNDTLVGMGGADVLEGGQGNDTLASGSLDGQFSDGLKDTLIGGPGNDTYVIRYEDVVVEQAGEGTDTIQLFGLEYGMPANVENLTVMLDGASSITGNGLGNVMIGAGGFDLMFGNAGNDKLVGMGGNDHFYGGADNDTLEGGAGWDFLAGETGADVMTGGADGDTFYFAKGSSSAQMHDIVTDFVSGQDRLEFMGIDANPTQAGIQSLTYVAGNGFLANGFGSVRMELINGTAQVQVDVDGNGTADLFIDLLGVNSVLPASDFVL